MSESLHTIGTYNMSFAGDAGLDPRRDGVFESEGAFHLSNNTGNPRQFWINALEIVKRFWRENPNASVLGLQEINKTVPGSDKGSTIIEQSMQTIAQEQGIQIQVITEEIVVNPNVKPALTCIWNSDKLGELKRHEIQDLDYIPGDEATEEITGRNGTKIKKSGRQQGRPILMIMTEKDYLLVVCHAPNHAELSAKTLADLRNALQTKITNFVGSETVQKDKIFIMGDFNDRYDALQKISLNLSGQPITLTYQGIAPLSCCHNWDSSCSDERFQPLSLNGRPGPTGTCDPKGQPLAGPGKRTVMGSEGNIENYRYYGDKVFGSNPVSDIQLFPSGRKGASTESDHEMVIATFKKDEQTFGGRRRKYMKKTQKKLRRKHMKKTAKKSR